MADKEDDKEQYNDEYQFSDEDLGTTQPGVEPDIFDTSEQVEAGAASAASSARAVEPTNVKRNAFIVLGAVFLVMLGYKIMSLYDSEKKTHQKTAARIAPAVVAPPAVVNNPPVTPPPVIAENPSPMINQKLSTLEVTQQSMRSEVDAVNTQLGGLNTNVTALSNQIVQLNQTIAALSAKLDEQSAVIEKLTVKAKRKVMSHKVKKAQTPFRYYLQAVIPGRAWLIATNGSTLTVREGTKIPRYGVVKLIDPLQGRVLMSSGQVIKFSQADS